MEAQLKHPLIGRKVEVNGHPDRVGGLVGIHYYKGHVVELTILWHCDWTQWNDENRGIATINGVSAVSGGSDNSVTYDRPEEILPYLSLLPDEQIDEFVMIHCGVCNIKIGIQRGYGDEIDCPHCQRGDDLEDLGIAHMLMIQEA